MSSDRRTYLQTVATAVAGPIAFSRSSTHTTDTHQTEGYGTGYGSAYSE